MDENNKVEEKVGHVAEKAKNTWSSLSNGQKLAVVGVAGAVIFSIGYVRQLRKEVTNLNNAVAYMLRDQGYFPIKK